MVAEFKSIFGNKGGRSGSFFLYSIDHKYILKTINKQELKVIMGKFLKEYHCHVEANENCLLSRILGVYSFELQGSYSVKLIMMPSIYLPDNIKAIYDLKGSKLDRQVDSLTELRTSKILQIDQVYKDLDFLQYQIALYLPHPSAERLLTIIERDVKFLRRFKIMDYSLLVVVKKTGEMSKYFYKSISEHEAGYALGIIDFLQEYNRSKKFESISKKIITMKPRMDISSINPEDYMTRFIGFIESIVTSRQDVKSFVSN